MPCFHFKDPKDRCFKKNKEMLVTIMNKQTCNFERKRGRTKKMRERKKREKKKKREREGERVRERATDRQIGGEREIVSRGTFCK